MCWRKSWDRSSTCFSMSRDDLNQWRGYAKGGYAIKFDPEVLKETVQQVANNGDEPLPESPPKPDLIAVEYIPERQYERVKMLVDEHIMELADAVKQEIDNALNVLRVVLVKRIIPLAASLKFKKFVGEAEHRLVSHCSETFYSPSSIGLIPGVRFAFSSDAVKGIVVGPGEFADVKKLSLEREDVPSSVELRWRSGEHQAALTSSLCTTGPTGLADSRSSAARSVGRCR
jgi:hypothetical protein